MPITSFLSNAALYVVPFLIVLTVIVFVHELGHFLVARWCGIRVRTFSIGFGREIWGFDDRHGTRWRLSLIPLGGYVQFHDAEPGEAPHAGGETERAIAAAASTAPTDGLRAAPLAHRALVVAAGPAANILFTLAVFSFVAMVFGVSSLAPRIGVVDVGSPAAAAGVMAGDIVTAVDGREVAGWSDVERQIGRGDGHPLSLAVTRGDRKLTFDVTPRMVERDNGVGGTVRVPEIGISVDVPAVLGEVVPGEAAAKAGLEVGDRVVAIDGRSLAGYRDLVATVVASPEKALTFSVERGARALELTVTPARLARKDAAGKDQVVGRIGVRGQAPPLRRLGPVDALVRGTSDTVEAVTAMLSGLVTLVASRDTAQVGGPIMMAEATAQVAKVGVSTLLMWMALLSANLGVFNLLPVPVLDGGHLAFYALEAIRRRPLSPRAEALGLRVGLALILMLMVVANVSDLVRLGKRLLG